ncbi:MAG: response regulator transcription factor [Actinomycetota bacterium]|nr:response regulator transcription factor [Actinomycetota bacterium]
MRIVIVEQWSILRSGLRTVLTQSGHAVLGMATTAEEALVVVDRERDPELAVIGSIGVPVGELLHDLAEAAPSLRTLVFLERADRPTVDLLLRAGVAGVLDQQTEGPQLLDAVDRIHRGERVFAPSVIDVLVGAGGLARDPAVRQHAVAVATEGVPLTARELEILGCLRTGATNRDIAGRLFIGEATVKSHLASAYAKLGVANRHQALVRAAQLGLITVTLPKLTPHAAAVG